MLQQLSLARRQAPDCGSGRPGSRRQHTGDIQAEGADEHRQTGAIRLQRSPSAYGSVSGAISILLIVRLRMPRTGSEPDSQADHQRATTGKKQHRMTRPRMIEASARAAAAHRFAPSIMPITDGAAMTEHRRLLGRSTPRRIDQRKYEAGRSRGDFSGAPITRFSAGTSPSQRRGRTSPPARR